MFEATKLKAARGEWHVYELQRLLKGFAGRELPELQAEAALITGDAIHNFRASLDLLACDIVRRAGLDPGTHTNFPIRRTRAEVESTIRNGRLHQVNPEVIRVILDQVRPFAGGMHDLCELHESDLMDRHRFVPPRVAAGMVAGDSGCVRSLELSFDAGHPFEGRDLVNTLACMAGHIRMVVEEVERAYP